MVAHILLYDVSVHKHNSTLRLFWCTVSHTAYTGVHAKNTVCIFCLCNIGNVNTDMHTSTQSVSSKLHYSPMGMKAKHVDASVLIQTMCLQAHDLYTTYAQTSGLGSQ